MASSFAAYVCLPPKGVVMEFPVSTTAGETGIVGEFMFYDASTDYRIERCGADPSNILGISNVNTDEARKLTPDNKIPFYVMNAEDVVAISSSTTPAQSHVGNSYGITRNGTTNFWQLDTAKTGGSARVTVVGVSTSPEIFYVRVQAQYLQFDTIAS